MVHVASFLFNPFQENTYVVYDDSGLAILIDPGCSNEAEWNILKDFIADKKLKPEVLLNTHCHLDHIMGNYRVYETWKLAPYFHPLEKEVMDWAPEHAKLFNVPLTPSPQPAGFIEEGVTLNYGGIEFKTLLVPGHSPGSLCFYCESDGFVIAGDTLFQQSIGRTDLPGGNHEQLLGAIRSELYTLPENTMVYPGHGPETTIAKEKASNPFLK